MRHLYVRLIPVLTILYFAVTGMGCGVDTFNYLDPPVTDGHTVYWSTEDRTQHYFGFRTTEVNFGSDFVFQGTEILYRIYSNASELMSVNSSISSTAESSQATTLISRGYKSLTLQSGSAPSPIIKTTGVNRHVEIRLADYSPNYARQIKIDNSVLGVPARYGTQKGFNFKSGDTNNPLPENSDADASINTFTEAGTYYVDVYSVCVGKDTSNNTISYSSVLHLGSVPIKTSWF